METIHRIVFPTVLVAARSVRAIEVGQHIECARASLLYLQRPQQVRAIGEGFVLTCLLCRDGEPEHLYDNRFLISVQEHLMERHGLTREDLSTSIRLNADGDAGLYLWTIPPVRAQALHLPHCCYLQAARNAPTQGTPLVAQLEGRVKQPLADWVTVVHRDEHAYYGYPHETEQRGNPLVFPLKEWNQEGGVQGEA